MSTVAVVHDEQHQRLEVKLRRELGEQVLQLLDDSLTEDILLNPVSSLLRPGPLRSSDLAHLGIDSLPHPAGGWFWPPRREWSLATRLRGAV